jgi:hypothetical protein
MPRFQPPAGPVPTPESPPRHRKCQPPGDDGSRAGRPARRRSHHAGGRTAINGRAFQCKRSPGGGARPGWPGSTPAASTAEMTKNPLDHAGLLDACNDPELAAAACCKHFVSAGLAVLSQLAQDAQSPLRGIISSKRREKVQPSSPPARSSASCLNLAMPLKRCFGVRALLDRIGSTIAIRRGMVHVSARVSNLQPPSSCTSDGGHLYVGPLQGRGVSP